MKKFKSTKYAHIGTSYTPIRDAEINKIEAEIKARQARLDAMFEKLLADNQDVLWRLKEKDIYTIEDFRNSRGK